MNRLLLHITPRSLVVDGLNTAIVHKDIITDEMIDRYWDLIRMDGTREATITRGRIRDKRPVSRTAIAKAVNSY